MRQKYRVIFLILLFEKRLVKSNDDRNNIREEDEKDLTGDTSHVWSITTVLHSVSVTKVSQLLSWWYQYCSWRPSLLHVAVHCHMCMVIFMGSRLCIWGINAYQPSIVCQKKTVHQFIDVVSTDFMNQLQFCMGEAAILFTFDQASHLSFTFASHRATLV